MGLPVYDSEQRAVKEEEKEVKEASYLFRVSRIKEKPTNAEIMEESLSQCITQMGGSIFKAVSQEGWWTTVRIPGEDLREVFTGICEKRCKYFEKCQQQYECNSAAFEKALAHYCKDCVLGGKG